MFIHLKKKKKGLDLDSKEQDKVSLSCQELPLAHPSSIQSERQQRVGQALETKVPNPTKGFTDPGCYQCTPQSTELDKD